MWYAPNASRKLTRRDSGKSMSLAVVLDAEDVLTGDRGIREVSGPLVVVVSCLSDYRGQYLLFSDVVLSPFCLVFLLPAADAAPLASPVAELREGGREGKGEDRG